MRRLAPIALALLAIGPNASVWASKPRCRLERIDPAPLKEDELRIYASVVELEGQVVEGLRASDFLLKVDGKPIGHAEKIQPFLSAKEEVRVALVVEVAAQYKPALEKVKGALHDFLGEQPPSMKVSLFTFGSDIEKKTPLPIAAAAMAGQLDDLSPDDDSVEVRMIDAVRLALGELNKAQPKEGQGVPPRRVIVLVSDGLNAKMDRKSFRDLGDAAAKAGVPIHAIAFSPIDERGPLLNLGELSKRSNGTFRWAQRADDLKVQLDTLADEMRKQYVVTFRTALSSTEKHTFALQCRDLTSNVLGDVHAAPSRSWMRGPSSFVVVLVFVLVLVLVFLRRPATLLSFVPRFSLRRRSGAPAGSPSVRVVGREVITPVLDAAVAAGAAPAGGARAQLWAVTGGLAGQHFSLAPQLTIGKAPGHTIVVTGDTTVSGNHCELRFDGARWIVRDLGSTNGTFVNGDRLTSPRALVDGDVVRLGIETQFKFRID